MDYDYADDAEPGLELSGTAQIIQCQGCEAISFRDVYRFSENGGQRTETLYPPRDDADLAAKLYLRDDVYDIPEITKTIYLETLEAVKHKLPTLAGMGIRAVIESICQEKKTKHRNLEGRIDELVCMSLLTHAGAKILHSIRLIGNAAAHEMKAPSMKQIIAALKVIDHLLLGVYVLPKEAEVLPQWQPKSQPEPSEQEQEH